MFYVSEKTENKTVPISEICEVKGSENIKSILLNLSICQKIRQYEKCIEILSKNRDKLTKK
jgi:hypothetical protein